MAAACNDCAPPGLALEERPGLGNTLISTRSFGVGEVVVAEKPLLVWKCRDEDAEQRSLLAAFADAPESVQDAVLQLAHPPLDDDRHVMVDTSRAFARRLLTSGPKVHRGLAEVAIHKLLLISAINAHTYFGEQVGAVVNILADGVAPSSSARSALFRSLSKVTHSCAPNTFYTSKRGIEAANVALRPIAAGEVITFSYGGDYATPRAERRELLQQSKLFHCRCARCCGVDDVCGLPCPSTGPSGAAGGGGAAAAAAGGAGASAARCRGTVLQRDGPTEAEATHGVWACTDCSGEWMWDDPALAPGLAAARALADEVDSLTQAMQAMGAGMIAVRGGPAIFAALVDRASTQLSPSHHVVQQALDAWVTYMASERVTVEQLPQRELHMLHDALAHAKRMGAGASSHRVAQLRAAIAAAEAGGATVPWHRGGRVDAVVHCEASGLLGARVVRLRECIAAGCTPAAFARSLPRGSPAAPCGIVADIARGPGTSAGGAPGCPAGTSHAPVAEVAMKAFWALGDLCDALERQGVGARGKGKQSMVYGVRGSPLQHLCIQAASSLAADYLPLLRLQMGKDDVDLVQLEARLRDIASKAATLPDALADPRHTFLVSSGSESDEEGEAAGERFLFGPLYGLATKMGLTRYADRPPPPHRVLPRTTPLPAGLNMARIAALVAGYDDDRGDAAARPTFAGCDDEEWLSAVPGSGTGVKKARGGASDAARGAGAGAKGKRKERQDPFANIQAAAAAAAAAVPAAASAAAADGQPGDCHDDALAAGISSPIATAAVSAVASAGDASAESEEGAPTVFGASGDDDNDDDEDPDVGGDDSGGDDDDRGDGDEDSDADDLTALLAFAARRRTGAAAHRSGRARAGRSTAAPAMSAAAAVATPASTPAAAAMTDRRRPLPPAPASMAAAAAAAAAAVVAARPPHPAAAHRDHARPGNAARAAVSAAAATHAGQPRNAGGRRTGMHGQVSRAHAASVPDAALAALPRATGADAAAGAAGCARPPRLRAPFRAAGASAPVTPGLVFRSAPPASTTPAASAAAAGLGGDLTAGARHSAAAAVDTRRASHGGHRAADAHHRSPPSAAAQHPLRHNPHWQPRRRAAPAGVSAGHGGGGAAGAGGFERAAHVTAAAAPADCRVAAAAAALAEPGAAVSSAPAARVSRL